MSSSTASARSTPGVCPSVEGVGDRVREGSGIVSAAPLRERPCPLAEVGGGSLAPVAVEGDGAAKDSGSAITTPPGDGAARSSPVQVLPGFVMSVIVVGEDESVEMGYSFKSLLSARTLPLIKRR